MVVLVEIRVIERLKNIVVKKLGLMWVVIERVGCVRKNGKN